jgi:hypothetical protein
MNPNRIGWSATALALTVSLAACDDAGAGRPGTLSLNLTDAPGDFSEAWVQIDRIELIGESDGGEGEESGAVVLMDTPVVTDLLSLANDVALLVDEAVVPAGRYAQLRMVIPEACIEVEEEDGSFSVYASSSAFTECGEPVGDLQMPSYGTSGLKIGMPGGSVSVDGDSRILLLDFDVHESFGKLAGGSGMWVMDPNVRAEDVSFAASLTVELTEADASGLAGVGGALSDFEAHLDSEAVPVAFEDPDEDGTWTATFLFLMPDTYEVSVQAAEGVTYDFTLDPEAPQSVTLGSGASDTVSFTLTSASAP